MEVGVGKGLGWFVGVKVMQQGRGRVQRRDIWCSKWFERLLHVVQALITQAKTKASHTSTSGCRYHSFSYTSLMCWLWL